MFYFFVLSDDLITCLRYLTCKFVSVLLKCYCFFFVSLNGDLECPKRHLLIKCIIIVVVFFFILMLLPCMTKKGTWFLCLLWPLQTNEHAVEHSLQNTTSSIALNKNKNS